MNHLKALTLIKYTVYNSGEHVAITVISLTMRNPQSGTSFTSPK